MSATSTPRRKPTYPGSLTDLHRFRKTAHGHDGSSRIVMVRKTDQRTFASIKNGQEPTLETITRETIETFCGQRTECKITTEKTDFEDHCPPDLIEALADRTTRRFKKPSVKKRTNIKMDFQNECLRAHNEYRKKHGVPPLKLDREISKISQQWADHLIRKGCLIHSQNSEYGENLYMMQSSNPNFSVSGNMPVDSWYDEIKVHKFGVEPKSLASGHFTQVVWKESEKLGVAFAKSGGKIVVVANYYRPGNMIGSFSENVPPPGSLSPSNNNNHVQLHENLNRLSLSSRSSIKDLRSITEGNFEEDFLNAHNNYRKIHGSPSLKLDRKLSKYAEEWAKHLAAKNILEHRPESNYGENIYCLYTSDPHFTINGYTPVDTWYEEIKHHPFGREPSNLKSGHFTQVIWKSSEYLGVGVAKNTQGSIYVVANYSPAGNFVGHYVDNVPPIKPVFYDRISDMAHSVETSKDGQSPKTDIIDAREFAKEALKVHNEYRRKHGVPDLSLSDEMCKYSQEWADTCARTSSLQHRANNSYGENIFSMYSSDYSYTPTARDAVKEWYDEIKKHTFGVEKVPQGSLHFTQLIWKISTELGVGIAKNKKGQTYVVCNYNPRGNYVGKFVDNVPPPIKSVVSNRNSDTAQSVAGSKNGQSPKADNLNASDYAKETLKVHNEYRRKHGVPDLTLSDEMCNYSQEWADTCSRTNILQHRPNNSYGENVFSMSSSDYSHIPTAKDAVKEWYDEIKFHTFGVEKVTRESLHFTQIIWKSSTELGVGITNNKKGQTFVVCNYNPKGNYVGKFVDNVPPPLKSVVSNQNNDTAQSVAASKNGQSSKPDNLNTSDFAKEALKVHNEYRRKHRVPDLSLNDEICKFAQEWADTCARTTILQHRPNNSYGENIFSMYSSDYSHTPTANDAVKDWYDEIKFHTFGVEKVTRESLHFTQLIWKSSAELGVGIAKNKKGQTYVVCNYNPKGNYVGKFVENVPKPGS